MDILNLLPDRYELLSAEISHDDIAKEVPSDGMRRPASASHELSDTLCLMFTEKEMLKF